MSRRRHALLVLSVLLAFGSIAPAAAAPSRAPLAATPGVWSGGSGNELLVLAVMKGPKGNQPIAVFEAGAGGCSDMPGMARGRGSLEGNSFEMTGAWACLEGPTAFPEFEKTITYNSATNTFIWTNGTTMYQRCVGDPLDHGEILGTEGDDVLNGTEGDDVIDGRGGNDTIRGKGGNDILCGDAGKDKIFGGDGYDVALGESGSDRIRLQDGADIAIGGKGKDRIYGGDGDDVMYGEGGDDPVMNGEAGKDWAHGGAGLDLCSAETRQSCGVTTPS